MKLSENWLREWVNPPATATELAHKLNMAGLEAEAEPMLAVLPKGIVVGKILSTTPHPQADRLRVCGVDAGTGELLQIVCGAANARPGILVPAALPGAVLPNGTQISKAALRGVESSGMLCSASELGLVEKSDGLLELDQSAKPGTPIEQHLGLVDHTIVLELTPNRGDCLSIAGLARETAALYGIQVHAPRIKPAVVEPETRISVIVDDISGCPHYVGRVVEGLNVAARTPDWMSERLRRSGIRTIHPVVDITNYVLLELGQPMHGFDAALLKGAIRVRRARTGEQLKLLNEQTVTLDPRDLLITDDTGPLVLAGIMGGEASGCSSTTTSVFLEAACFEPVSIATSGRRHKLLSDSRYRFERGVDPALQRQALERATALVQDICGGKAGPIVEVGTAPAHVANIALRHSQVNRLLGCEIPAARIVPLLHSLGMAVSPTGASSWKVKVPPHRYDLRIEADLVEEIGRLHGYDHIAPRAYAAELAPFSASETTRQLDRVKDALIARGYQEVVTYSFVDPKIQVQLDPETPGVLLDNPIAETMAVMRTTIWSGLIPTWQYNRQRQQKRARLFEAGAVYALEGDTNREQAKLAGLIAGPALPEQWGAAARPVDFFDAKADLEALFGGALRYEASQHPALHPGRTARIVRDGVAVGWLGALHPKLADALDIPDALYLFELDWTAVRDITLPAPGGVSEFPSSRRDLAFVVDESVTADAVAEVIRDAAGPLLKCLQTFDVYRGTGLPAGRKSIAFGLIFQDYSRTLNVEEVDAAAHSVAASVHARLGGLVRD
ncbi:MAG: phenylalanine--tRNA ligase subunit beta [Xanthomonadaceae bacterium]|nr:phenylalanine--tRNA ligase subunit beta [Xanthomonadaceae bacterium]